MNDGGNRKAWHRVGSLVVCGAVAFAIGGTAVAEEDVVGVKPASTQPAVGHAGERTSTRPGRLHRNAGAAAAATKDDLPSDEEWKGVVDFMGKYSPNRLKAIEEQKPGPRYANLRKMVWDHYRDLTATREKGDQELYDLKLNLVQADDQAWSLQRQMHDASDDDRAVIHHELRLKMAEVVRLGLKERGLRIDRLEKALAEEKEKLANDQQNVDQRVAERMQAIAASARGDGNRAGHSGYEASSATTSQVK